MKRILLLFSVLMLSCIALWAHDVEIGGIYYKLHGYKTAEVTYRGGYCYSYDNEYSGSVTIPETITYNSEIYSVTSIGDLAFYDCWKLTSITIPNSVTSIGDFAFKDCEKLTSITIPNSVTSIGYETFWSCSGLTSVTIPNSVTSIGEDAFYNCRGLRKVNYLGTVDKWVEFDFNDYDSNPTYYAKDLYLNNKLLTDVKITTADSIKDYAFYNCQSIKSVEIGNSVTFIGDAAFYNCSGLTEVTIPNSVTYIGSGAFEDCSGLTSVAIPNNVTQIYGDTFKNCSELKSVSIGESVNTIGAEAFVGCENLKKITMYPMNVPSTQGTETFSHYNAYLYVPCAVYEDYDLDDVFGNFKYIKCIAAEEVDAPEKVEIEVDEDNNANVIWPSTDGAKKYELEISKNGEVFCTLLFNENGQLTSIDFGNRSASVGFQFTVTGLDSASKYAYSMVAMDKKGNELQSYKGTFTTNGYVPGSGEEDEPSAIIETLADANITVSGGTISADADFSIYNTIGQDVTAINGSLQPGVYLVSIENNIVKVMVK